VERRERWCLSHIHQNHQQKSRMNWYKNIASLSSNISLSCRPMNVGRWVLVVTRLCYSSVTMTVPTYLDAVCSMYLCVHAGFVKWDARVSVSKTH
jgi:hypothetical protein